MRSSDKCCYHRHLFPPHNGILRAFSHTPTSVNRFKNSACALDFPLNLYNLVQPFIYIHTEFGWLVVVCFIKLRSYIRFPAPGFLT